MTHITEPEGCRKALLDAALTYAKRGWAVFPLQPGTKVPLERSRGFKDATTNPATIRRLWTAPNNNIGISAGAVSGMWLLDVDNKDGRDGEASLRKLEAKYGPLPATLEAITPNGGRHLWFKYTCPVPSSNDRIGSGLEVKCDTGYGVAPPSVFEGRTYERSVDSTDEPVAAPQWLIDLARKPTISEQAIAVMRRPCALPVNEFRSDRYGRAALDDEIATLASWPRGSRNHQLNRATFNLFQLVAGGELSEGEVLSELVKAAEANGLTKDPPSFFRGVLRTIASGKRAGLQHPRNRGGRL